MTSDVKPKRAAREPGHNDFSPGQPAPAEPGPNPAAIVPDLILAEPPKAAEVISAPLEAAAHVATETATATVALLRVGLLGDSVADSQLPGDSRLAGDSWRAAAEAQVALARGLEAIAVEMTGMTRSGIAAAADAAIALFGARTFSEAVEINATLARRGFDAMVEGSARLSEIGVRAVSEASRPMLSRP